MTNQSKSKTMLRCFQICRNLQRRVRKLEKKINNNVEAISPSTTHDELLPQHQIEDKITEDSSQAEIIKAELRCDSLFVGYMTICSSVQTSGRKQELALQQVSATKAALAGTTVDVSNFEDYLQKLGPLVHRQAKYEYSAESVSAASKDEFLKSLSFFFGNARNDSCLLFYSGHGLPNTSLIFETSVENYHVGYEDVISQWRSRTNLRNKHFFIVLDCCYAGSWVIEIFKKGDFREISIQGSSTYLQKSNDLGPEFGSLFTALITKENGLVNSINLSQPDVIKKMDTQTPMSFCGKWGMSDKVFRRVGFNSWNELIHSYPSKVIKSSNGLISLMTKTILDTSISINSFFENVAIIIEKDRLLLQGEILSSNNEKICIVTKIKRIFPSNMIGCVSIWTFNGKRNAIFFRESKSKKFAFEVPNNLLSKSLDILREWIDTFDAVNLDTPAGFDLIDSALMILTEINKNNLLHSDEYIEDENEEEIDFDSLKLESSSNLEHLSLSGQLEEKTLEKILKYIRNNASALKSLALENCICEFPNIDNFKGLDSFSVTIHNSSPFSTFDWILNKLPFSLKNLSINFDKGLEAKIKDILPLNFSNFTITTVLKSLSISNIPMLYYIDLIKFVTNTRSLTTIWLANCDFASNNSEELLSGIFSNEGINSVALINSNLSTKVVPPRHISYLNLSKNKLISINVKPILTTKYTTKYVINLSHNMINTTIFADLACFFKDNNLCDEINLSGNHFGSEILTLARMNLIYKCSIVTMNLSDSNLSSCDIASFTNLLCKAKQLKFLVMRNCMLQLNQLSQITDLLKDEATTSITSIDISYNRIASEDFYSTLRRRVKFSKSLQSLLMACCFDITSTKPLMTDGFFSGAQGNLAQIDYSGWKATYGFDVGYAVSKSLTKVDIKNFSFAADKNRKLNLKVLELDILEVDSNSLCYIDMPKSCKNLLIHEINEEIISSNSSILNQVQSLSLINSNPEMFNSSTREVLNCILSKDIKSSEVNKHNLNLLISEDSDEITVEYFKEISSNYLNVIRLRLTTSSDVKIDPNSKITIGRDESEVQLQESYNEISDDLIRILVKRNYFSQHDSSTFAIVNNRELELNSTLKCISLQRNCFNIDSLLNFKFEALEILELNAIYLSKNLPFIQQFISQNPKVKVLSIKDSEINMNEVKIVCALVQILQSSIEEIHLIDTFIDSREIRSLFTALLECPVLTTINLSGNNISKKMIIEFVVSHPSVHSLILRDCALTKEQAQDILSILDRKPIQVIDISGLRLKLEAQKNMIKHSKLDLINRNKDYSLEIGYSTKVFSPHCSHRLRVLHLNQISFEFSSNLLNKVLHSVEELEMVTVTRCQEESSFMKNLYFLLKSIKVKYLDISCSLMTETNTHYLIDFLKDQFKLCLQKAIKVNISKTNLEDKCFELLYNYIIFEKDDHDKLLLDISHNMLTSFSSKLIELLEEDKKNSFQVNMQGSFAGDMKELQDIFYSKKRSYIQRYNDLNFDPPQIKNPKSLKEHSSGVYALIKIDDNTVLSGSDDFTIKLWDVSTAACIKTMIGHSGSINNLLKVSNDLVVSGSSDSSIKFWQLSTATCVNTITYHKKDVNGLIILNDNLLISGSFDRTIKLWQIDQAQCLNAISYEKGRIFSLLGINDDVFASGSDDKSICIWQASTAKCTQILTGHKDTVNSLLKLNNDNIASGSQDNSIRIWQISTETCILTMEGHTGCIYSLIQIDEFILSGSTDKTIKKWRISNGVCEKTLKDEVNSCVYILLKMNENLVLSGCEDKSIKYWAFDRIAVIENKAPLSPVIISEEDVINCFLMMNENLIITGSNDYRIKLWETSTWNLLNTLTGHDGCVLALEKMTNDLFVSGSWDFTIMLWKASSGTCIRTITGHEGAVLKIIKVSDDTIISGSTDGKIKLWQVSIGNCMMTIEGHKEEISTLIRLSDDSIISTSSDYSMKVWRLSTAMLIRSYKLPKCASSLLSLNDKMLLIGLERIINIYSLDEGLAYDPGFEGHRGDITSIIKISDDLIASSSSDYAMKIWRISTKECLMTMNLEGVVFTLLKINESQILSGSEDYMLRLWTLKDMVISADS